MAAQEAKRPQCWPMVLFQAGVWLEVLKTMVMTTEQKKTPVLKGCNQKVGMEHEKTKLQHRPSQLIKQIQL